MLTITKNTVGATDVYRLKGTFDAYNASNFRNELLGEIEKGRYFIVLNMAELDLIDSTGLGFLVSLLKTILKYNGKFCLAQLPAVIEEIFVMTKLDRVFPIYDTEQDAINHCKA